jgi:hypothetical protein
LNMKNVKHQELISARKARKYDELGLELNL